MLQTPFGASPEALLRERDSLAKSMGRPARDSVQQVHEACISILNDDGGHVFEVNDTSTLLVDSPFRPIHVAEGNVHVTYTRPKVFKRGLDQIDNIFPNCRARLQVTKVEIQLHRTLPCAFVRAVLSDQVVVLRTVRGSLQVDHSILRKAALVTHNSQLSNGWLTCAYIDFFYELIKTFLFAQCFAKPYYA